MKIANDLLPAPPPPPVDARYVVVEPESRRMLTLTGLPQGHWTVRHGDALLAAAAADEWAKGVELVGGPMVAQAEKVRRLVVLKDEQFFNQWRPANETYIFGFRRNEQGQNAREMPMFDRPIAEKEAEIAKFLAAAPYTLRIEREDE